MTKCGDLMTVLTELNMLVSHSQHTPRQEFVCEQKIVSGFATQDRDITVCLKTAALPVCVVARKNRSSPLRIFSETVSPLVHVSFNGSRFARLRARVKAASRIRLACGNKTAVKVGQLKLKRKPFKLQIQKCSETKRIVDVYAANRFDIRSAPPTIPPSSVSLYKSLSHGTLHGISFHKKVTGFQQQQQKKEKEETVKGIMLRRFNDSSLRSNPEENWSAIRRQKVHTFIGVDWELERSSFRKFRLTFSGKIPNPYGFSIVAFAPCKTEKSADLLRIHTTKATKTAVQLDLQPTFPFVVGSQEAPRFLNRTACKQFVLPSNFTRTNAHAVNNTRKNASLNAEKPSLNQKDEEKINVAKKCDFEMSAYATENLSEWAEFCLCVKNILHLYTFRSNSKFGDRCCTQREAYSRQLPAAPRYKSLPPLATHLQKCRQLRRSPAVFSVSSDRYDPTQPTCENK